MTRPPAVNYAYPAWQDFFTAFRDDGWPICPNCRRDGLSTEEVGEPPDWSPTIAAMVDAGLLCVICRWDFPSRTERLAAGGAL